MSVKVRITTVMALLVLPLALLQGCGGSSNDSASSTVGQSLNLEMSSSNGVAVLLADGVSSVPLQMQVSTQSGQALANTPVTFSTTAGTLSAIPGTNVIKNAQGASAAPRQTVNGKITIGTDANGVALVLLTSSNFVETAVVAAEVNGFKQSLRIDFISGFPTQLELTSSVSLVAEGGTSTLLATVTDENGDPLAGVTVTFQLLSNVSEGASVSPTSSKTDVNGRAQATYQAGTTSGTDTIQATISTAATSGTGGDSISATTTIAVQPEVVGNVASDIQLLVSSPQLDSDGVETVTLTALVRDSNNNLLPDVHVTFSTEDSAAIQVTRGTTDETGTAEAILSTGGDPSNRTITVRAIAGILVSENTVQVSGTTITFSGNNSLAHDETASLSILLRDSSGTGIADQPVTLTSTSTAGNASINNGGSNAEVTTGFNGQATFDVTVSGSGTYTIEASALGATGTFDITVNASDFKFVTPEALTEVPLIPDDIDCAGQPTSCLNVSVHFEQDGEALTDGSIEFTTTRGSFVDPDLVFPDNLKSSLVVDVTPLMEGNVSAVIRANNAGFAEITAICRPPQGTVGHVCDNTPTIQRVIEFVATEPAMDGLSLEANPASIGVNTDGLTNEQSTITAVVRDASNNLVKNQRIDFTLDDITGGTINPAFAITDSFGRASTVYTAGSVSSSSGGVVVTATVHGMPNVKPKFVKLTVANKALFIKIGTANVIFEEDDVLYRYPYSVIVTDSSGNSVPGATVELSVTSTRYQKGFYFFSIGDDRWIKSVAATCPNEDTNGNGILDPGEEMNGNSKLDPGEVAAVTEAVVTNENGVGFFDLHYAQEFTWVEIQLTARAAVAGTESESSATFFLPGVASDFNSQDVVPPGQISPFGVQAGCGNTN
jgi:ethanolamine utilization microcompartment shell protein EutS